MIANLPQITLNRPQNDQKMTKNDRHAKLQENDRNTTANRPKKDQKMTTE